MTHVSMGGVASGHASEGSFKNVSSSWLLKFLVTNSSSISIPRS